MGSTLAYGARVFPVNDINIIDIEASGLHIDSYPIEIAILINKKIYSWLIKPADEWVYWCRDAEALHGISREMLFSEGVNATVVAFELNDVLENTHGLLYSDAAPWDSEWVKTLFDFAGIPQTFHILSIYDLVRHDDIALLRNNISFLSESGKYLKHRAEQDVRMIHEAYLLTLTE